MDTDALHIGLGITPDKHKRP